jgi:hypothetical protein
VAERPRTRATMRRRSDFVNRVSCKAFGRGNMQVEINGEFLLEKDTQMAFMSKKGRRIVSSNRKLATPAAPSLATPQDAAMSAGAVHREEREKKRRAQERRRREAEDRNRRTLKRFGIRPEDF